MLSVIDAECHTYTHYAECCFAECRHAVCRYAWCLGALTGSHRAQFFPQGAHQTWLQGGGL
jgi:hypothetical protein